MNNTTYKNKNKEISIEIINMMAKKGLTIREGVSILMDCLYYTIEKGSRIDPQLANDITETLIGQAALTFPMCEN